MGGRVDYEKFSAGFFRLLYRFGLVALMRFGTVKFRAMRVIVGAAFVPIVGAALRVKVDQASAYLAGIGISGKVYGDCAFAASAFLGNDGKGFH